MGIDQRFTAHFATRFQGLTVLETGTGAGFTTMALARTARHVYTIDIDPEIQAMARHNVFLVGLEHKVSFLTGDVPGSGLLDALPEVQAAFLDPDWAVTGPDHQHRFIDATTRPPADALLSEIMERTEAIALVLPPTIPLHELAELPSHETERLYLEGSFELLCLYFGSLAAAHAETAFSVP